MEDLSSDTLALVQKIFASEKQEEACNLLREITLSDAATRERAHFAALRHSKGDLEKLRQAVETGKWDFRDLLSLGHFTASTTAHHKWRDSILGPKTEDSAVSETE